MIIDTDALSASELMQALLYAAEDAYPRDRDKFAAASPLTPDNLFGSYFRAPDPNDPNAEAQWLAHEPCSTIEGAIVGQPHVTPMTSFYLVEFYGREGALGYQQIVDMDRMVVQRWMFFDSDTWLTTGGVPYGEPSEAVKEEKPKAAKAAPVRKRKQAG